MPGRHSNVRHSLNDGVFPAVVNEIVFFENPTLIKFSQIIDAN